MPTAELDPSAPHMILILALVGVLFGVINTLAGGGSVLSLPALLLLGLPPHAANATNRVVGITQTMSALWSFAHRGKLKGASLLPLSLIASAGGVLGARISLLLSQAQMNLCIQLCLGSIATFTLLAPRRLFEEPPPEARSPNTQLIGALLVALYGGFIQAGIGLVSLYYMRFICGHSLVKATALKVVFIAALTVPSLVTFIYYGQVWWISGAALALGGLIGAQIGVYLSLGAHGARVIRRALPFAALLMLAGLIWRNFSA